MSNTQIEIPDIRIRNVDPETQRILLAEQAKQKEKRGINQFSLSSTIKLIVREWEKCKERK